jgi:kynurenine formamidase
MPLHGTTHLDALGHVWYDDQLYNGFDANTTKGGLDRCDVRPIAEHGLVGHGVLLDIARHRGVDHLERNDRITLEDIKECADEQDVAINQRDVLLLRTGWLELFYDGDKEAFFGDSFREPGITYSEELVRWFYEQEIPVYGTDTLANEQTRSETTDSYFPVHAALLRDQGLIFIEILNLETLAGHCASTGQYEFLFVSSPLKFTGATGSPVNPIVVA